MTESTHHHRTHTGHAGDDTTISDDTTTSDDTTNPEGQVQL